MNKRDDISVVFNGLTLLATVIFGILELLLK